MNLDEQIEAKKRQLDRTRPHSERRTILFAQLRELVLKQLRREIRKDRAA